MSLYVINTAAAQKATYTGTPGTITGYVTDTQLGKKSYRLLTTTDAWVAQGIADTPLTSQNGTADTLTAASHKLITGMPVQLTALVDVAITKAWQVAAGAPTFVDITTAINNATANDAQPFPTGEVTGDYFAVGYNTTFGQIKVVLGTSGTVGTLTWEYWNGTAWTALSGVTDNTTQFKAAPGTYTVTYTTPIDWAARTLNGSASLFYIRAKVGTSYTVDPLITQAFIEGVLPSGLSGGTTYWAIAVDANTFQLATSRANALAGTAIDLTSNGGGVTATTVAVANTDGSGFVAAKTWLDIDGSLGAKVSVVQDASGGTASMYPVLGVK